jgi:hypothetical protein
VVRCLLQTCIRRRLYGGLPSRSIPQARLLCAVHLKVEATPPLQFAYPRGVWMGPITAIDTCSSSVDRAGRGDRQARAHDPCLGARPPRLRQASGTGVDRIVQAWGHPLNRALSAPGGAARAATALPRSYPAPPRDHHRNPDSGAGQRRSRPHGCRGTGTCPPAHDRRREASVAPLRPRITRGVSQHRQMRGHVPKLSPPSHVG